MACMAPVHRRVKRRAAWRYPVPLSGILRGRQVPFPQDFGYQSTERISVSTNWPSNSSRLTDGRSDACLYRPNAIELLAALATVLRIDSVICEMINLLP